MEGASNCNPEQASSVSHVEESGSIRSNAAPQSNASLRISIIDPRALGGEVIKLALHSMSDQFRCETYADVDGWRASSRRPSDAAIILLIIGAADADDPGLIEDLQSLHQDFSQIPAIVIGEIETPSQVAKILGYGVRGYIPTSLNLTVAVGAISLVLAGGLFVPAHSLLISQQERGSASQASASAARLLTERQAAVAEALSRGKANKVIAYELNLCESTVKVHVRSIMKKLQARNRTEAAFRLRSLTAR